MYTIMMYVLSSRVPTPLFDRYKLLLLLSNGIYNSIIIMYASMYIVQYPVVYEKGVEG